VAHRRRLYHSTQSVAPIKAHIDPEILIEDFKRRQERFRKYRERFTKELNVPYIEISYESLQEKHESEMGRAFLFLDVNEHVASKTELVKVNPDSLNEIIENYVEVENVLRNTEYEKYL
jgi:hypothetical protein